MAASKTIGIIGGGQLGQMMAISAIYAGHKVISLDPAADCPASKVSQVIQAPYDDVDALRRLAEQADVLTYEFENVDADALDAVAQLAPIPQGTRLLRLSQNRILEKRFLSQELGLPVAPYREIESAADLEDYDFSVTRVLKTATGGYDGHGQVVIRDQEDLEAARNLVEQSRCVLEDFVTFEKEVSVLISGNGESYTVFPVQENQHRNNILSKTLVPARINEGLSRRAKEIAYKIATELSLFGTLCIELFVAGDQLLVNEIAPRPHNSGHYSIEACNFSQFDTHIKGILGQPLPEIVLHGPAVMLNVLGQDLEAAEAFVAADPQAHLHLYGKEEAKVNRKMGHITVLAEDADL